MTSIHQLSSWLQYVAPGIVLAFLSSAAPAFAGVVITPVSVELSPANRVASVRIINTGSTPMTIQSSAVAWSQADNTDQYTETSELLVAPAIAVIPANSTQVFRVALRGAFPKAGERTFRLYLEDVTEPKEGQGGVSIRIRHNLPVMVTGPGPGKALPRLGACPSPSPSGCVRFENQGDRSMKVTALTVEQGKWRKDIKGATVVLAGAWKQWTFAAPPNPSGGIKATAETSVGPISADLSKAQP
jgi:P pilus assembly chaperone PapD